MTEDDAGSHAPSQRPSHHRDVVAAEPGRRYPDQDIARPDGWRVPLPDSQRGRVSRRLQYQGSHAPSIGGRLRVDKDGQRL